MDFIQKEIAKYTSQLTDTAKDSAIETLNDPEFKKAINAFVHDFVDEHKFIIIMIVGSLLSVTVMATINVAKDYRR